MYHQLEHEVADILLTLDHQPTKVYIMLTKYANITTGVCWPGYARIKEECKITSGSEVLHAINVLVDAGLITTWLNGNKRHYQVL